MGQDELKGFTFGGLYGNGEQQFADHLHKGKKELFITAENIRHFCSYSGWPREKLAAPIEIRRNGEILPMKRGSNDKYESMEHPGQPGEIVHIEVTFEGETYKVSWLRPLEGINYAYYFEYAGKALRMAGIMDDPTLEQIGEVGHHEDVKVFAELFARRKGLEWPPATSSKAQ